MRDLQHTPYPRMPPQDELIAPGDDSHKVYTAPKEPALVALWHAAGRPAKPDGGFWSAATLGKAAIRRTAKGDPLVLLGAYLAHKPGVFATTDVITWAEKAAAAMVAERRPSLTEADDGYAEAIHEATSRLLLEAMHEKD